MQAQNKILSHTAATHWRASLNASEKLVFTNGCFDLIHRGHLAYLEQAKSLGDYLVVGLNSDDSVRRLKGEKRPINVLPDRAAFLAALQFVDLIVSFDTDTPLELIVDLQPHILVKGGDYKVDEIVGAKEVQENGGMVQVIPFLDGYSSTQLIERIVERYGQNS